MPRDPHFRQKVLDSFARQSLMRTLDARIITVEPGYCEIELPYDNNFCQQHGYLHGGITGTLADTAAGYVAFSLMPAGSSPLTSEFKINLLAPAKGERFVARARVLRSGRTLSIVQSEVFAEHSANTVQTAVALVSIMCMSEKPDRPAA